MAVGPVEPSSRIPTEQWWRRNAQPSGVTPGSEQEPFPLMWYLRTAARVLAGAGVPSPGPDALELASFVSGVERLVPAMSPPPDAAFADAFREVVQRRASREPLQHITSRGYFRHLALDVGPGVFIPRPETEIVAQVAIDEARRLVDDSARMAAGMRPIVIDLCAGSGAIAIAVATEVPEADVIAVELDDVAAGYAAGNMGRYATANLRLLLDDVTSPFVLNDMIGLADVVISNPPYIPPDAVPIDPEVREYDPGVALFGGGSDGLEVPRAVVAVAKKLLPDGGLFIMEHADSQGEQVRELTAKGGAFVDIHTGVDLAGRERFVTARRRMRVRASQ